MTTALELIERLKAAQTIPEIAKATAAILQACGVWNYQGVAHELSRLCVTEDRE